MRYGEYSMTSVCLVSSIKETGSKPMKRRKKVRASDPLSPTVTGRGDKPTIVVPPYIKPWTQFPKTVHVGDNVTIHRRVFCEERFMYDLAKHTGEVREVTEHIVVILCQEEVGQKERSFPWWSIHDWEIHDEESNSSSGSAL